MSNPEASQPLLEVRGLAKSFYTGGGLLSALTPARTRQRVQAVNGISFAVRRGEVYGLVGESGSGKSVSAQLIMRLTEPDAGSILFAGQDVTSLRGAALRPFRRRVQIVFQNPYDSLNPRFTVEEAVMEPLRVNGFRDRGERRRRVIQALEQVGLQRAADYARRHPHQLSGGEQQRVCIARVLVLEPELLVADEPTSMLDVSVRAGILNLISRLRETAGLSVLFISHDLSTVKYLCDRTAVMYRGRIVELGPTDRVMAMGLHPYTRALADAVPVPDPDARRDQAAGRRIPPSEPPAGTAGCAFAPRCPDRMDVCATVQPDPVGVGDEHSVCCHLFGKGGGPGS